MTIHPGYFALDFLAAATAATVAVVVGQMGATGDIVAVLGAMLAASLTVIEARKRDRALGNTVSVFLGSSFVGSIAPGAVFNTLYPEAAAKFNWQVWCSLGFICGLVGWSVVLAAVTTFQRRKDAFIESAANRFLPEPPHPADPPEGPES